MPVGKPPAPERNDRPRPEIKRKRSYREQQELDGIEAAITAAEARVAGLEAELADPSIYKARAAEVPALVAALGAGRTEVERLYARWQDLEAVGR